MKARLLVVLLFAVSISAQKKHAASKTSEPVKAVCMASEACNTFRQLAEVKDPIVSSADFACFYTNLPQAYFGPTMDHFFLLTRSVEVSQMDGKKTSLVKKTQLQAVDDGLPGTSYYAPDSPVDGSGTMSTFSEDCQTIRFSHWLWHNRQNITTGSLEIRKSTGRFVYTHDGGVDTLYGYCITLQH
jgi:hypothetical protein